jgi:hypothetical protein
MSPIKPFGSVVDATNGIIYSNVLPEYNSSTDYKIYYVKVDIVDSITGEASTRIELLSPKKIWNLATIDDFLPGTTTLDPTKKVYTIENFGDVFQINLPSVGTYTYKPLISSRLKILPSTSSAVEEPWFVRVSNGNILTNVKNSRLRYRIAEFLSQTFNPAPPIKYINQEISNVVSPAIIKLDRRNILISSTENYHLTMHINDIDGNPVAAFTTDPTLNGALAPNLLHYQLWDSTNRVGIRSIDKLTGFIDIEGLELKTTYIVYSSYYYEEEEYEYTKINLNPLINSNIVGKRLVLFIEPELPGEYKSKTLYYLLVDESGKVIESDWSQFNNSTQTMIDNHDLYYEDWPSFLDATIPAGTHKFIDEFAVSSSTSTTNLLVLGDVAISTDSAIESLATFDSRVRGGGIKEEFIEQARAIEPDVNWFWDIGKWDGRAYPGHSAFYVDIPVTLLEDAGGLFTSEQIKEIVSRHVATGVYPVVRAYGAEIASITGITPTNNSITIQWQGRPFEDKSIVYNVYYTTTGDYPWTLANTSPIAYSPTGNSYTITGLTQNTLYSIAIVGGILDTGSNFIPLRTQAIGPYNRGATNDIDATLLVSTYQHQ